MRWRGRSGSQNIEDRRGAGMALPVGGGIGGLVLILLFAMLGGDPTDLTNMVPSDPSVTSGPPADDPQTQFLSVVLADTETAWSEIFRQNGRVYEPPTLVLFTGATQSACGLGQSAMGPFYCPADRKVYLDVSFFRDLDQRFGAPGDFAQAYVVAHEVGHHVQTLTGLSARVQQARQSASEEEGNALSVRQELQADCYAGIYGQAAARNGYLDPGDVEEGLAAAAAIGDDRLQRQGSGRVVPESFTHGSSEQRVSWLRRGMQAGSLDACETFAAR